jgi:membrane protease YdiL (CAAX protease family)
MDARIIRRAMIGLVCWFLAFLAGVFIQTRVLFKVFYVPGITADQVARDPRIWLVLLVQPAVTLSILTLVLYWQGETWQQLGLRLPHDWMRFVRHVATGMLVMLVAAYLIRNLIIWPLHLQSRLGGFHAIQGNPLGLAGLLGYVILVVGLNEELLFRGFFQTRVERLFGRWHMAGVVAAVIAGVVFGLVHGFQGSANAVYAGLLGIALGIIYLRADRNLWVVVVLHSVFDVQRAIQFFLTGSDL